MGWKVKMVEPVDKYREVDIYFDASKGKFTARVYSGSSARRGDIKAATIQKIKSMIDERLGVSEKAIRAIYKGWRDEPKEVQVLGLGGTHKSKIRYRTLEGRIDVDNGTFYLYDEKTMTEIKRLCKEIKDKEKEIEKLQDSLTTITVESLKEK
jgi:hypothetical protein